jgi:hypothetical protein
MKSEENPQDKVIDSSEDAWNKKAEAAKKIIKDRGGVLPAPVAPVAPVMVPEIPKKDLN